MDHIKQVAGAGLTESRSPDRAPRRSTRRSMFVMLAAAAITSCTGASADLELGDNVLRRSGSDSVPIPLIITNTGETPIMSEGCAGTPSDEALNASIQYRQNGRWNGRNDPSVRCAPPTIGSFILVAGETRTFSVARPLVPGEYRVRVFFKEVGGDPADWFPTGYRRFTVVE